MADEAAAAEVAIPRAPSPVAETAVVAVDTFLPAAAATVNRWGKWALVRVTLTEGYFANMSAEGFETRTVVCGTSHRSWTEEDKGVRMMEARETTRCSIVSGFEVERCCAGAGRGSTRSES